MSFLDIQFPQELLPHFNKTIQYATSVGRMKNGKEFRRSIKDGTMLSYELFKSIKQAEKISILEDFFHAAQGQMYSFKIFDSTDHKIENVVCRHLTANTVQIQKVSQFQDVLNAKDVTKPKKETVRVYKDGALLVSGYDVNYQTGVITFDDDVSQSIITATCEYFHHVRFNADSITFSMKGNASFEVEGVTMIEVLD
jgi:uncharacterized protein (TIGR02217 family)